MNATNLFLPQLPPVEGAQFPRMKASMKCVWLHALAVIFCTGNSLFADTFGLFTYTDNGTTITITDYPNDAVGVVVIPPTINGKPVTHIGHSAFEDCWNLTGVTIPQSVTNIGEIAFVGCDSLTSITIPSSVTSIDDRAFQTCSSMVSITVAPTNPAYSSDDGILLNKSLTTIIQCPGGKTGSYIIPNSVTSIRVEEFTSMRGAFTGSKLSSVTIGSGVTIIGTAAFMECSNLMNVVIPNGVTSLGAWAFSGCPSLTTISLPPSVSSLGYGTFAYSWNLTSVYFGGNAPSVVAGDPFNDTHEGGGGPNETVYYLLGTTGWGPTFYNRPTVQLGVSIITQPANVITRQWMSATFSVTAVTGTGFQWQKNEVDIPLATSATLTLNSVQASDEGSYRVIIFNPAGNATSDAATLTVLPDTDADGLTNAEEATYGTDPNKADTDADGINDKSEIQVYLTNPLLKDTDGDGFEDLFEVNTGFNPTLASSTPDSASSISGAVGFRFNAGLGLSYRIEDSTDLQNWNVLETPIIGEGGVVTRFYFTEGHAKRYFRVRRN